MDETCLERKNASSVWEMLSLMCILGIHVETLSPEFGGEIWFGDKHLRI